MADLDHRIRIITNAVYDKINSNKGPLGLKYVGKYDEKRLPRYPAAVVAPGDKVKSLRGTNTFNIELSATIWVYHGDMTVPHAVRTEKDLELVDKIEVLMEDEYTLGGLVIFGYIATQVSGIVQPLTSKSELIAGTRMDWVGLSQRRMRA